MLTITETAGAHLAQLLSQTETPEGAVIRIVPGTAGNLAMQFDHVHVDDKTFAHESKTVLVYGAQVAPTLENSTLDVRDTGEGPKLVLQRH